MELLSRLANCCAFGLESEMDGSSETWCKCLWLVEFMSCALGSASCDLWVVSLHEFGEFLSEVSCWILFCVLGVESFVPC
jgi:hypothetical protein